MLAESRRLLDEALSRLGGTVSEDSISRFQAYLDMLGRWRHAIGLTSIDGETDIVIKHFIDSLALLPYLGGGEIADVGSGGGFPGAPVAIARPEISVVFVEKDSAKCRFLEALVGRLDLRGVVVQAHSESYASEKGFTGFETVCARALADPVVAMRMCAPLVRQGGKLLLQVGPSALGRVDELSAAARGVRCRVSAIDESELPLDRGRRGIVIVERQVSGGL